MPSTSSFPRLDCLFSQHCLRGCLTTLLLPALALLSWTHPAVGEPSAAPSTRPSPKASPSARPTWVGKDTLRLKLVHRILLDRNPKAGMPDERSMVEPAPPEVLATDVIPRIVEDDSEVTFLSAAGEVMKRIPLADDPKLSMTAVLSPGGEAVAVGSTFSGLVNTGEKAEGGEWPKTVKVYDRSGQLTLTTTVGSSDSAHVSDSGAVVFDDVLTGELTFVNRQTGARLTQFQFLGPYGGGRPKAAISRSGERILVGITTTSLDGDTRTSVILRDQADYLRRAVREVWVGLFDAAGTELWRKKLPEAGEIRNVGLSDDGSLAFVATKRLEPGVPITEPLFRNLGFILDGSGNAFSSSTGWGGGNFGSRFSSELGGFLLGGEKCSWAKVARPDGSTEVFFDFITDKTEPLLSGAYFLSRSIRPNRVAVLALRKSRLVLILRDRSGTILLARHLPGRNSFREARPDPELPPDEGPALTDLTDRALLNGYLPAWVHLSEDGSMVAVGIPRPTPENISQITTPFLEEVRIFKILTIGAPKEDGR